MAVDLFADGDRRAGGTPPRRRALRGFLRRMRAATRPGDVGSDRLRCLGDVCVVLDDARALIERGWRQNDWYVACPRVGGARAAGAPGVRTPVGIEVSGACLVGAVVYAIRRREPGADPIEAAPALDVLWDAWQESRGLRGAGVAGRAAPPAVRAARVRDLTRWNDQPGRTRDEVLGLIDLATSLAIMEAAGRTR
jgi:hypothetical protein